MPRKAKSTQPRKYQPLEALPDHDIVKQRSVAFNLELDVNNLRTEIRNLEMLRKIFQSKSLQARHSMHGSCMQTIDLFFRVFHQGFRCSDNGVMQLPSSSSSVTDESCLIDQTEFLYAVLDEQVDCDNGFYGPSFVAEQFQLFSSVLQFIRLQMVGIEIIDSDDSVVIHTQAISTFRFLPQSVEFLFPHVASNAFLREQLVGQVIETPTCIKFAFDNHGKAYRYNVELDFIAALTKIFDFELVTLLMANSRVSRSIIEIEEDALEQEPVQISEPESEQELSDEYASAATRSSTLHDPYASELVHEEDVITFVQLYYDVVGASIKQSLKGSCIAGLVDQAVNVNDNQGLQFLVRQWEELNTDFDITSFYLDTIRRPCYFNDGVWIVETQGVYELRLDAQALDRVFPHVPPHSRVYQELRGSSISCKATICFSISQKLRRITCLSEVLHLQQALSGLLSSESDLVWVTDGLLLTDNAWD